MPDLYCVRADSGTHAEHFIHVKSYLYLYRTRFFGQKFALRRRI